MLRPCRPSPPKTWALCRHRFARLHYGEPFYLLGIEGRLLSNIKGHEDEFYYLLSCRWHDGRHFTASTGSAFALPAIRWDELAPCPPGDERTARVKRDATARPYGW